MTVVHHPLAAEDAKPMASMREALAPAKGQIDGPSARGAFDEVMERTPDAAGVTYESGAVGGVAGVWCRPENAQLAAALLYLHGGAYVVGSAHAYRHLVGQVAVRARTAAFVPNYRPAPEHRFPAALDDATAVYQGLVAGDPKLSAMRIFDRICSPYGRKRFHLMS